MCQGVKVLRGIGQFKGVSVNDYERLMRLYRVLRPHFDLEVYSPGPAYLSCGDLHLWFDQDGHVGLVMKGNPGGIAFKSSEVLQDWVECLYAQHTYDEMAELLGISRDVVHKLVRYLVGCGRLTAREKRTVLKECSLTAPG